MLRFLNTWTGELESYNVTKLITYAILSHVWRNPNNGGEQSYDDVRRIQAAVQNGRSSISDGGLYGASIFSYPELSDKIKG